jgi:hypothetical protein
MRRFLMGVLLAGVACQDNGGGGVERHGSSSPGLKDPGPAPNGEYGNDPGVPDAGASDDGPASEGEDAEPAAPPDAGGLTDAQVIEIPLRMMAGEVARVACRRRLECCDPATRHGLPDDAAGCTQALAELLQPFVDEVGRSVGGDRATYDGVALGHCLDALAAADCSQARTWEPLLVGESCPFLGPTLGGGQACRSSYECDKGFCAGVNLTRDGRCTSPRLADGQPCDRGDDCVSGACHPTLDTCAAPTPGNLCD